MHIPDGYLSPATCAVLGGVMVPVTAIAVARAKEVAKSRYAPLIATGAAFSFLVQMLNVPVPDGTTAHAVGAVLIAILLGPWAAVIAVTVALIIQAFLFGDGGVLALGANAFNMAFIMPFVGYGIYRLLSYGSSLSSRRRVLAAGIGGYVGITAAALCAAIEFGIQPDLFETADGTPLYAPFHLSQTIPAMLLAHLTVAGFAELALTAGVVAYLQRANLPLLAFKHRGIAETADDSSPPRSAWRWALIGIGVTALLTPLGLLAPGGAFGEDAPAELDLGKYHLGAVPRGLVKYADFWQHTLFADYGFSSGQHETLAYLISAGLGILAAGAAVFAIVVTTRFVSGRAERSPSAETA